MIAASNPCSGFREAFVRVFGQPPGRIRQDGQRVVVTLLESPLGPLLAGTNDHGIVFLEFTDRRSSNTTSRQCAAGLVARSFPDSIPLLER